ncbi:MAG: alpha/beta fold hydrolase [Phycisphaerae bacterium]
MPLRRAESAKPESGQSRDRKGAVGLGVEAIPASPTTLAAPDRPLPYGRGSDGARVPADATRDASAARRFKNEILAELSRHPFRSAWWLRNAHGQTIWTYLFRRVRRAAFESTAVPTPDGDELWLHRLHGDPLGPTALLLHGLGSSAQAPWIHGLTALLAPHGWNVAVMEFRSCGGRMNRTHRTYSAGDVDDVETSIAHLRAGGVRSIYLVGFSLGGSVAARLLGLRGAASGLSGAAASVCGAAAQVSRAVAPVSGAEAQVSVSGAPVQDSRAVARVSGAAVVAAPFDLSKCAATISRALGGRYSRYFMQLLIPQALEKARQFPGLIDVERLRTCRTMEEFDAIVTAKVFGYAGVDDYYARCSCGPLMTRIRVPTLVIASRDDPFVPAESIPNEMLDSPWIIPQITRDGGHQGFIAGVWPGRARYWGELQVARFLLACERARLT